MWHLRKHSDRRDRRSRKAESSGGTVGRERSRGAREETRAAQALDTRTPESTPTEPDDLARYYRSEDGTIHVLW
jgi:hypothetical protein